MNPNSTKEDENCPTDCCICINAMSPFQALFLAPCSHCFHYKCVTTLLGAGFMFQCPLCRQVANLEASVAEPDDYDQMQLEELEERESLSTDENDNDEVVETATTQRRDRPESLNTQNVTENPQAAHSSMAIENSVPVDIPHSTTMATPDLVQSPSTPRNHSNMLGTLLRSDTAINLPNSPPAQTSTNPGVAEPLPNQLFVTLKNIGTAAAQGDQLTIDESLEMYTQQLKEVLSSVMRDADPELQNQILSRLAIPPPAE